MKNENDYKKYSNKDKSSMIKCFLKLIWYKLKRSVIDLPEKDMYTNSQKAEAENCTPNFIVIYLRKRQRKNVKRELDHILCICFNLISENLLGAYGKLLLS